MIEYIVGLFLFLKAYTDLKFFLIKRNIKGPTKIMRGAEPYFYKKSKVGVLLIHGFTSSPGEFKNLATFLKNKNITVFSPLLPGHGTSPEHLSVTKWYDWVESLNANMEILSKQCNKIFLIGNSLGGNLAFLLASNNKSINGIISLGTPITFRKEKIGKAFLLILKNIKLFQTKHYTKEVKERLIMKKHTSYPVIPLKSMTAVFKVIEESKKILPEIKKPTLLMHSATDPIVNKSSVDYLYKKINSKIKKIIMVPDSYHVFLNDKHKTLVYKEIFKFIKQNS